jgi:hypothetical protein
MATPFEASPASGSAEPLETHRRGVKKQVIGTQSQDFLDGLS